MRTYDRETGADPGSGSGERRAIPTIVWVLLGIIAVVALVVVAVALFQDDSEEAGPEVGETVGNVAADPDAYRDEPVEISGAIVEVLSPQAFVLSSEYGGTAELVVLSRRPVELSAEQLAGDVDEDDVLTATGVTDTLDESLVEEVVGGELDGWEQFEDLPVLVTDQAVVFAGPGEPHEPND